MEVSLLEVSDSYFADPSSSCKKARDDPLNYKTETLPNGLKIFYIEDVDPMTKNSAAALQVQIGSDYDFDDFQGVAHFLEHMLFMGSRKYPNVNYFENLISSNNGQSNAFTEHDKTCYHFTVPNHVFMDALDAFACFFTGPLFDSTTVDKEINAINAEHMKNIMQPNARLNALIKEFIVSEHPSHKFATGSLETLVKEDPEALRNALVIFFNRFYSAHLMTLFVYHNNVDVSTTNEIREMFKKIPTRSVQAVRYPPKIFSSASGTSAVRSKIQIVEAQSINDSHIMCVINELDRSPDFSDLAIELIEKLFNSEQSDSMRSYLIRHGYAVNMITHVMATYPVKMIFIVEIELTSKGFINRYQVLDIVREHSNPEYLNYAKVQERINEIYHDINSSVRLEFLDCSKKDAMTFILDLIDNMPPSSSVIAKVKAKAFSLNDILVHKLYPPSQSQTLETLRKAMTTMHTNTDLVIFITPHVDEANLTDKHYGIKYKTFVVDWNKIQQTIREMNQEEKLKPKPARRKKELPVTQERRKSVQKSAARVAPSRKVSVPAANASRSSINQSSYRQQMVKLQGMPFLADGTRGFFIDNQNQFNSLNTIVVASIEVPEMYAGDKIQNYVHLKMYLGCIFAQYAREIEKMESANYEMSLNPSNEHMVVYAHGPKENFLKAFSKFMSILFAYTDTEKPPVIQDFIFDNALLNLESDLRDFKNEPPFKRVQDILYKNVLPSRYLPVDDLSKRLKTVSHTDWPQILTSVREMMFSNVSLVGIVSNSDQYDQIVKLFCKHLPAANATITATLHQRQQDKIVKFIQRHQEFIEENRDSDVNSAVLYIVKMDDLSKDNVVIQDIILLLEILIGAAFYDDMRNKQQLGYIVTSYVFNINRDNQNRQLCQAFLIQSPNRDVTYLKRQIEDFCTSGFYHRLKVLTDDELSRLKSGLLSNLSETTENINQRALYHYKQILTCAGQAPTFNKKTALLQALQGITKEDVIKYYRQKFIDDRRSIMVGIVGSRGGPTK